MNDNNERHSELLSIMKERVRTLSKKHNFRISPQDKLGILMAMKIIDKVGMDYKKSINDSIIAVGLQKKYPNLPITYPFVYRN